MPTKTGNVHPHPTGQRSIQGLLSCVYQSSCRDGTDTPTIAIHKKTSKVPNAVALLDCNLSVSVPKKTLTFAG